MNMEYLNSSTKSSRRSIFGSTNNSSKLKENQSQEQYRIEVNPPPSIKSSNIFEKQNAHLRQSHSIVKPFQPNIIYENHPPSTVIYNQQARTQLNSSRTPISNSRIIINQQPIPQRVYRNVSPSRIVQHQRIEKSPLPIHYISQRPQERVITKVVENQPKIIKVIDNEPIERQLMNMSAVNNNLKQNYCQLVEQYRYLKDGIVCGDVVDQVRFLNCYIPHVESIFNSETYNALNKIEHFHRSGQSQIHKIERKIIKRIQ